MIEGLSHMTFVVRDLDAMSELLVGVLDAKEVYSSGDRQFSLSQEKFFLIGDLWVAIMKGDSLAERTYNHIAFKIDDADFDRYLARVEALGLHVRPPRERVEGEGRSIYFYDRDNHMFELHTGTLGQRLQSYVQDRDAAK